MTVEHLRPAKKVNTQLWLTEAFEAAKNADALVVLALYEDERTQDVRISYCNLNEQQLTWIAAKLQDYVTAKRMEDF